MSFLGFIVDKEGLRTDRAKIEAIINFPRPTNRTELRGVLGFAMFYRQFVKNFSSIVALLNELLRKNRSMEWTDKQEQAFNMLKEKLTTSPVLARPDFTHEFKLYMDASAIGLGAILAQDDIETKEEREIIYASRGTRGAEQKYGSTQLECLAVVWAVELFRHYLLVRQFQVITDYSALQ